MRPRWASLPLAAALACTPAVGRPAPSVRVATHVGGVPGPAARDVESPYEAQRVALPRDAAQRFRIEDDPDRPLLASVYSLPSTLVDGGEAEAMLAAVRAADPRREILVLVDAAMEARLAPLAARLRLRLLLARGGPYSPWPRDPFSFARASEGSVRLIVRPNLQPGREADADLGPELARDLPPDLDRAWGGVRWARAAVPFHNGQVLLTRDAAWVTLHTFEPRALELLGLPRVPVESFYTAAGIEAYVGAVRRAAGELAELYGRPVRFVHPLPEAAPDRPLEGREQLWRLGGGAGYDLDSLVALLPGPGRGSALVADLTLGGRLLAALTPPEWRAFANDYGLAPDGLPAAMTAASGSARGRALAGFLDLVAAHLQGLGFRVRRLPLLVAPVPGRGEPVDPLRDDFLVTWANVVVERRADGARAEGFSGLLPAGDRLAAEAFAAAGVHLDLLPPLLGSVERNGGYRCASNHLRASD